MQNTALQLLPRATAIAYELCLVLRTQISHKIHASTAASRIMDWLTNPITPPEQRFQQTALNRQQQLTKPPGSLGELERLAIRLCAMQATDKPSVDKVWISIFAADHGIATAGVSAFPQAVTAEMVKNFVQGGAAISVLAKQYQAHLEIIDVGVASYLTGLAIIEQKVALGTANFLTQPAMSGQQLSLRAKWA